MISLDLPIPPPANNLFMNLRKGKGRARTPAYLNWITSAGWRVQIARQSPIAGPVCVFLKVRENPRRDLDGYLKPVLDLLVTHRLIPDDRNKIVRELHAEWSNEVEACRVTVRPVSREICDPVSQSSVRRG